MLISELIAELEDCIQLYGNKEVYVRDEFGQLEKTTEVIETGMIKNEDGCVVTII